jgi:hypothetical protein
VRVQGQQLIAKEYLRADRPSAARHEYDALRRLEALHLAPKPLFFDPRVGPVVVYRYMEGEMWDRRVPSAAELGALAELWLRFHCLGTDGFWLATGQARSWGEIEARVRAPVQSYAVWADRTAPQFRHAAGLCLEALDRSLAAARRFIPSQTPLCFCRSDARFANVIARTDGRLGLVDLGPVRPGNNRDRWRAATYRPCMWPSTALGQYLRARRELLRPEDVSLPNVSRRRVPGLRREELAILAGISSD